MNAAESRSLMELFEDRPPSLGKHDHDGDPVVGARTLTRGALTTRAFHGALLLMDQPPATTDHSGVSAYGVLAALLQSGGVVFWSRHSARSSVSQKLRVSIHRVRLLPVDSALPESGREPPKRRVEPTGLPTPVHKWMVKTFGLVKGHSSVVGSA